MKFLAALALLAIGFSLGRHFAEHTPSPTASPAGAAGAGCDEIARFRGDFEEYQKLKTEAEKFRKADEILSRIMQVFLADLGLRVQNTALSTPARGAPVSPIPPSVPVATAASPAPQLEAPSQGRVPAFRRKFEAKVAEAVHESEVKEDLKQLEIKDLFSELKKAGPPSDEQISMINGHYLGNIAFFNGQPDWSLEWEADLRRVSGSWKGRQLILLTDSKGRVMSRTSGDGSPKSFLGLSGGRGLLVNVHGDDGYVQLYFVWALDKIYGNYYERKGLDQFEMTGTVTLQRTR